MESTAANKGSSTPDFEAALRELEELVVSLEEGELSLEESLRRFERGVRLTRLCQQALREAEQKVQILLQADEEAEPEPFAGPEGPGGPA